MNKCKNKNLLIVLSFLLVLFLSLNCAYAVSDSGGSVDLENGLPDSVSLDSNYQSDDFSAGVIDDANDDLNLNDDCLKSDDLNLNDDCLRSDDSQESPLGFSDDSNVIKAHRYVTVDNWDDLKTYAEDGENRYTITLKENTVFTPTSQIVCNQKISIIGKDGAVIGGSEGSSVSVSPFVFKGNGIVIQGIDFKYISSRVIYIQGNATITNCSFDHIGGNSIYLDGGHVDVYDCNFTNSSQAIVLYGDENVGPYYSFLNIYNSNFINLKMGNGGYAGAIRNSGQLLLVNCTFMNNRADTWGGCIASNPNTNITIYNSTFENNVAGWNGGAISTYSYLQVYNTVFRNNHCTTNYGGGAIFALTYVSDAHLWIVNSTFENNINTCFEENGISTGFLGKGGAISIGDTSTLNVYNSTFIGNLAANGLAICSSGYEGYGDPETVIGGNTFINHTGESETLMGKATVYDNTFINSNVHYNLKSTYPVFYLGLSSLINVNLENPSYYDSDLLSRTNFTLFITNPDGSVETVNIKGNETYEFTPTLAGKYIIYAESSSFSNRSGNLSVVVTGLESPVINDDNFEDYFENTSTRNYADYIYKLKNLKVYNDTIFIGSLTDKYLIFNQKLNIIGKEDNCLTDCTIKLSSSSSGSTINGLNIIKARMTYSGNSYSYIILEKGINDINLVNNHVTNMGGSGRFVSAIELNADNDNAISNINIINNTIVIDSSGENVYGIYASSNNAESLNNIAIVGNNISINGTEHIEAIYLYKMGDSIIKDNVIGIFANGSEEIVDAYGINTYGISGVNITNNSIDVASSKAAFGLTLSEIDNVNVLDNEIHVDGISAIGLGLTGSSSDDVNLMNNDLSVNAGDYSSISTYDDKFGTGANGIVVSGGASANVYNNDLSGNASSMNTSDAGKIINRPGTEPASSKFSYSPITALAAANAGENNNVYFKVKLLDDSNKIIKSRDVIVRYNGVDYKVKTDSNGIAQLKVNLPVPGTYKFSVSFDGDDYYKASSGNFNLVVKKNAVKVTVKTKKVKKSKSKRTMKFVLKTSNNKVLKSKKVKLTINKKTYTVKTDKKGFATFKVKLANKKKTYKYKLAFAGDKMNSAKSISGKLKVY